MDNILNTITAYREERKWSLYDLAIHAEMKSTTISTWYTKLAVKDDSKGAVSTTQAAAPYRPKRRVRHFS